MSDALVEVEGLATGYGAETSLSEVTFMARAGEGIAVLGPNGGGKTTLFRALLGELPVHEGRVRLNAAPAYVPQTERSRLDFPVSALDVVVMGAFGRTPWWRRISREDREIARAALDRVGLSGRAGHRYGTLSGGQRQRVLIARALTQRSSILLLDEPLSGVDRASARQIDELFDELRAEGCALLVATHDTTDARRLDAVLCLNRRQIAFGPPERALTLEALEQTYGGELVLLDGGRRAVTTHHHPHE
jgi:ABC-type Mn2+/Zn2+ transport system ATPase subunit